MDISFLKEIPHLRSLRLLRGVSDLTPVTRRTHLERLWVSEFHSQELDLSSFSRLREAEIPWKVGARSLSQLEAVEELTVTRWKGAVVVGICLDEGSDWQFFSAEDREFQGEPKLIHFRHLLENDPH
ncbi:hypothetical protein [Streptomyces sp. NPDC051569]|uniref:hypothetical protein n=1 Tax=Streptomyces sp. NPDC051569 TaxID=3365661 RepID=UPI0037AFEDDB